MNETDEIKLRIQLKLRQIDHYHLLAEQNESRSAALGFMETAATLQNEIQRILQEQQNQRVNRRLQRDNNFSSRPPDNTPRPEMGAAGSTYNCTRCGQQLASGTAVCSCFLVPLPTPSFTQRETYSCVTCGHRIPNRERQCSNCLHVHSHSTRDAQITIQQDAIERFRSQTLFLPANQNWSCGRCQHVNDLTTIACEECTLPR